MEAWIIAAVGLGSAVLGAVIGGLITLALEVWRRALDGVSAARLIRMELVGNGNTIRLALAGRKGSLTLSDTDWRSHRVTLAPLLDEVELGTLWRDLGFMPQAQILVGLATQGSPAGTETAKRELDRWRKVLHTHIRKLRELEGRNKLRHIWRLLVGSYLATEDELEAAFSPPLGKAEEGE